MGAPLVVASGMSVSPSPSRITATLPVVGVAADESSSRFSLPPALEGRRGGRSLTLSPVGPSRSGAAETSRDEVRGRLLAFEGGGWFLLGGPDFFFSGFSGGGNSTS